MPSHTLCLTLYADTARAAEQPGNGDGVVRTPSGDAESLRVGDGDRLYLPP